MRTPAVGIFDIGSNTVLLTCGRQDAAGNLDILLECHDVARLSEGLKDGQALLPAAKNRVLEVMKKFKDTAAQRGIVDLRAAGTAAFRRAGDGAAFAQEITQALGIPTTILSGQEEAHYSYQSARAAFAQGEEEIGMIDIGGGSTELVFGKGETWHSLPMGTVRFLEEFIQHDPIPNEAWTACQKEIYRILEKAIPRKTEVPKKWVAVAATPSALASLMQKLSGFAVEKVHGFPLHYPELLQLVETLRSTPLAEREHLPGMLEKRAELLPLGGLILVAVMKFFKLDEVIASHHGLRYGILAETLRRLDE